MNLKVIMLIDKPDTEYILYDFHLQKDLENAI